MDDFLRALPQGNGPLPRLFTEFDTIYLGGGTPSLLSPHQIERTLKKIQSSFSVVPDSEITMEVNPADWGRIELSEVRGMGVNRISIGVQSFSDSELTFLGRRHTSDQALSALEDAMFAGFDNISIDLM
jgi:oxygen-independent coproporphyrinogen-3 oxidase